MKKASVLLVAGIVLGLFSVACAQEEKYPWPSWASTKYRGVELTFATVKTMHFPPDEHLVREVFEKKTGIKIKFELIPNAVLHEKLVTDFASGAGIYDLVEFGGNWIPEFVEGGYLVKLDPYFEDPRFPDLELEDFLPVLLDAKATYKGSYYAIPHQADIFLNFYRKDLFNQSGLVPPKTWDEFIDVARKLQRDTDGDGKIDFYGAGLMMERSIAGYMTAWMFLKCYDASMFDENMRPAFNSPAGRNALRMYKQIYEVSPPGVLNMMSHDLATLLIQGRVAQAPNWPYVGFLMNNPEESIIVGKGAIATLPGGKVDGRIVHGSMVFGWSLAINEGSKNKDAAYFLLNYLDSKEGTLRRVLPEGMVDPTRFSVYADPEVMKKYPDFAIVKESLMTGKVPPKIPEFHEVAMSLITNFQKALMGTLSIEKALADTEKEVDQMMRRYGYY